MSAKKNSSRKKQQQDLDFDKAFKHAEKNHVIKTKKQNPVYFLFTVIFVVIFILAMLLPGIAFLL